MNAFHISHRAMHVEPANPFIHLLLSLFWPPDYATQELPDAGTALMRPLTHPHQQACKLPLKLEHWPELAASVDRLNCGTHTALPAAPHTIRQSIK